MQLKEVDIMHGKRLIYKPIFTRVCACIIVYQGGKSEKLHVY